VTIRKGEEWGTLAVPTGPVVTLSCDAALRELVIACRRDDAAIPTVGLAGGDLMRTLGGRGDASRFDGGEPIPHLPVDIVSVVADDARESLFVAHLVARRSWWRGVVTAAMNAQFHGQWDVAPRSHPNDGRVDVVIAGADLGVQQRWMARSRLKLGTHVPHPSISVRQHASVTIDLAPSTPVWLDGERWGSATRLALTVHPDALTVCV
jgi:hypothetical protein